MAYSRLLSADKLNSIKRTYLHDCRPIICEKEKIIEFWDSLSLSQKERIFIVYDLNIVDEFVSLLSQVQQKESRQKATQMIKMPEKRVLLEFIYFEDLAGLLLDNHPLLHSFLRTICLISNKVTNDPAEISLEDADIPDCTDYALLQGRKRVLKFKIRAIMNMFEMLEMVVDSFCSGEKVLMRKRHYSSLFAQLISNNNPESSIQSADSSEEIRVKLRGILELLSIMFENNLIKSYLKASKHAAARQDVNEGEVKSAKELRIGVLEREDSQKIRKNTIEENKLEKNSSTRDCVDKDEISKVKEEHKAKDNADISGTLDKHEDDDKSRIEAAASEDYHLISPIEKDSHLVSQVSADASGQQLHNLHLQEQQELSLNCQQQVKVIKGEFFDNESQSENSNNKLSANLTAEEQDLLEEQQKRECMQEIERQLELVQEAARYLEISESNVSKDDCSEMNNYNQQRLQCFPQSDVEILSRALCAVNLSNLVFKILPEDQTSESDEELYEIDERENFHYNQELKDYDIADVLGDGFKFEPSLCLSKQQIQSILSAYQPQQFSKNNNNNNSNYHQDRNKQQSYTEQFNIQKPQDYQKQALFMKYRTSDDSPNDYDPSRQYQNPESRDAPRSTKNNAHRHNPRGANSNNNNLPPGFFRPQLDSVGMQFPSFNNQMHPFPPGLPWMSNNSNSSILANNLQKNTAKGTRNSNNNNSFRDNSHFDAYTSGYQINNQTEDYANNVNNQYAWPNGQAQYNQSNSSSHSNSRNDRGNSNNNSISNTNARQVYSNSNQSGSNQQQQQPNGISNQSSSYNHSKRKKHYSSRGINNQSDNNQTTSICSPADSGNYLQNKGNSNEKPQSSQGSCSNFSQNEASSSSHSNSAKQKARSNKKINPASKHVEFNQLSQTQITTTNIQHSLNPLGNTLKRTKDLN